MPDSQNRRNAGFGQYDAMSTEELRQLLREDASKQEGEESDMEVLLHVMEVLARRRQAQGEGKSPEEALESFQKNYMQEGGLPSDWESSATARKHTPNVRRWMRGLIAAAAVIALIMGSSLTAKAFGFDLWEIFAQWTQETFHFGYVADNSSNMEPNSESKEVFEALHTALNDYEIDTLLVPNWIPEGYIPLDVQVFDTPKQRQFVGYYQNNSNTIKIWISDYLGVEPTQIEQSDTAVEVYESSGVKYYIFSDNSQLRAAWITETFECYISGALSVDELKMMIDSITKE